MDFNFNDIKSNKKNNLSGLFIDKEAIHRLFSAFFHLDVTEMFKFSSDYSRCILPNAIRTSIWIARTDYYIKNPNEFYKDLNELISSQMEIEGCPISPIIDFEQNICYKFIIDFLKAFKRIDSISLFDILELDKKNGKAFEEVLEKAKCVIFKNQYKKIKWAFAIKSKYCVIDLLHFSRIPSIEFFDGIASKHIIIDLEKVSEYNLDLIFFEETFDWIIGLITNPAAEIIINYPNPRSANMEWINEYRSKLSRKSNIPIKMLSEVLIKKYIK